MFFNLQILSTKNSKDTLIQFLLCQLVRKYQNVEQEEFPRECLDFILPALT